MSDSRGEVFARFGVLSQPALVLIDPDGKVETLLGAVNEARLETLFTELAAK